MPTPPTFSDFVSLFDFSQWEIAVQNFFCDSTQGGGLFVKPPDNSDTTRESWIPPVGEIAFLTGFQASLFQVARPRISLSPVNYQQVEEIRIQDATGRLFHNGWKVPLDFGVITRADYAYHTQMLATCRAVIHFMNPTPASPVDGTQAQANIGTSGLNAFLTTHSLSRIWDAGGPTFGGHLLNDKSYYLTPMRYNAVFAVQPGAWPSGVLNA